MRVVPLTRLLVIKLTIKKLMLVIDQKLSLEAAGFSPLKLEHGDYCDKVTGFPVKESLAIREGAFEVRAIDTFDKVHKCKGRFPSRMMPFHDYYCV